MALVRAPVPITLIPERSRLDVVTHTVTAGDTLYGIAQRYKLNAETIMFSNGLEKNPDLLRLGQQLIILPLNGIYHTVGPKDTIQSIAKAYKVTPEAIIQYPPEPPGCAEPDRRGRAEAGRTGGREGTAEARRDGLPDTLRHVAAPAS